MMPIRLLYRFQNTSIRSGPKLDPESKYGTASTENAGRVRSRIKPSNIRFITCDKEDSVADPDPGFGTFLTPVSGIRVENQDPDPR